MMGSRAHGVMAIGTSNSVIKIKNYYYEIMNYDPKMQKHM